VELAFSARQVFVDGVAIIDWRPPSSTSYTHHASLVLVFELERVWPQPFLPFEHVLVA